MLETESWCALFLLQLAPAGGRLIMASDGVWDAVSTRRAARCCRGVQRPESAAKYVVKVRDSGIFLIHKIFPN